MAGYIGSQTPVVSNGSQRKYTFTATAAQTVFTGMDIPNPQQIQVFQNGVRLVITTDYTVSSGTTVTLVNAASAGDSLVVILFADYQLLDTDALTFTGGTTIEGDLTVDTNTLYVDSTNNRVGVGTASPSNPFQVGTSDLIVDSSGNLLVGMTSNSVTATGIGLVTDGISHMYSGGTHTLELGRGTNDGDILKFNRSGTTVGSIAAIGGDLIIFSTATGHSGLRFASTYVGPTDNSGTSVDNTFDMGAAVYRWDDIYATNGTIQTSDANEKQQIAELTAAEMQAAKAISKLFKTFKWNDSVAEKGDAARTHTGVIAQEVEQAMTDAGLNAGDYAFFISSDWTDEETGEERNRKGIRYPQLMSFIGAATEQRLASIEARLDALEGN